MRLQCQFFALLLLASIAHADVFYSGNLAIGLDSNSLNAGETLKGKALVTNFESAAFNDASVILEIVSGKKGSLGYPSQFSDEGEVILEKEIDGRVDAKGQRTIPFEITLPKNLTAGTYTLDAYYRNGRAPISGIAHIFSSPESAEFEVRGTGGALPHINIVRTATQFNGQTGPVGSPAAANSDIGGKVYVRNSSAKSEAVTVWAGMCDWDDTLCSGFLSQDSKEIVIEAKGLGAAGLALKAPALPGAYAIRIEARSKSGEMLSLYRNRLIVTGPTAKIWHLDIGSQKLEPQKGAKITAMVGPTPDHFTFPELKDFEVRVWVEGDGSRVYGGSQKIGSLAARDEAMLLGFDFAPKSAHSSFRVCSSVEKDLVQLDLYCFDVSPIEDSAPVPQGGRIDVKSDYAKSSGTLRLEVCGFGPDGNPDTLDASLALSELEGGAAVRQARISGENCHMDFVRVDEQTRYLLIVDDFRNHTQVSRELLFGETQLSCNTQGGVICEDFQTCKGKRIEAVDTGACCMGSCSGSQPQKQVFSQGFLPEPKSDNTLLLAAGLFVVIIVILKIISGRNDEKWGAEQ